VHRAECFNLKLDRPTQETLLACKKMSPCTLEYGIDGDCPKLQEISFVEYASKAIIYRDLEDVYGPCGCGKDMAMLPVLLPRHWLVEETPEEVAYHEFCKGFDYRRAVGMSCSNVFEHLVDGVEFLANYSCCKECAERAVSCGYAVYSDKGYPMVLR
jgi:hypothetical protein